MVDGRIVIAGAGIGGLTLASALQKSGRHVIVLERSGVAAPLGFGMTVQPNAFKALRDIGLDGAVFAAGHRLVEATIRHFRGKVLATTSFAALERELGAPVLAIHRSWLHDVLLDAAGRDIVKTTFSVATYEQTPTDVVCIAEDDRQVHGAILVGADGLWSRVRSTLVGDGPPIYAGYTSWRGVADGWDLTPPGRASESWGKGRRFGIVPIGRGKVYWFATANARAGERDPEDVAGALAHRFHDFHAPVAEIIRATPPKQILRTDIYDRPPIRRWSDGRVTLLGDAAHPMTPNLGQGGCQAIEDAAVLSRALGEHGDLIAAFRQYEAQRVTRANDIVRRSRALGDVAQWSGDVQRFVRDTAMRLTPKSVLMRGLRPLLTFEP
jgi:2-polyprenyl-6-methoxyphenol hydroxylase-like FAD-dependent oxidoreductase